MASWIPLSAAFSSRPNPDEKLQEELRAQAVPRGVAEFVRQLSEGRLPAETWRHRVACSGKTDLFFPDPVNADDDRLAEGKHVERVEFGRPQRLAEAKKICDGCPVKAECTAWSLRIGGADKHALLGGITHNTRKQIGTLLRINLQGGHPLIDEWGWGRYRRVVREVRKNLLAATEPQADDEESDAA